MASLVATERILSDERMQRALLDRIGALYVSASQRSFAQQRWGDEAWPARYPRQKNKLNIAGALRDFAAGRRAPLARRFQDRPALIDTGELRRSIAHRVVADGGVLYVEVGTTLPYAAKQLYGGETVIRITQAIRDRAREWLQTPKGKAYRTQLWRIVSVRSGMYVERNQARRFLGTTPDLERAAAALIVACAEAGLEGCDAAA